MAFTPFPSAALEEICLWSASPLFVARQEQASSANSRLHGFLRATTGRKKRAEAHPGTFQFSRKKSELHLSERIEIFELVAFNFRMAGPHLTWLELLIRLGSALLLGAVIGAERQWRQRTAGLRTYSLVSVGAALFVLLAALIGSREEASRIAAQVVSGVGFLGAGVLMRTGLTVHGLNTASTIWCSAAVGVLAGNGFYAAALLGTIFVLIINIFLRSVAEWVGRHSKDKAESAIQYGIQVVCRGRQESRVRTLLIQLLAGSSLTLHQVESAVGKDDLHTVISATLTAVDRNDAQIEQITSRLSLERDVTGVSWQALPPTTIE
jgi:putative Mg2+ transporter-C (MgtC) family protein